MDTEYWRQLTAFANQLVHKRPTLPLLVPPASGGQFSSLVASVDHLLTERHRERKLILPDLSASNNKGVGLFSDYSGEGSGLFNVYSVLVCGMNMRGVSEERAQAIRDDAKLGTTEFAFKALRMGQMRRALPHYLEAANHLPGFILTVAVDKRIKSVFGSEPDTGKRLATLLHESGFQRRPVKTVEKMMRVVHLIAYLASLLGHDGQNLFWMTDHDDISPGGRQPHATSQSARESASVL